MHFDGKMLPDLIGNKMVERIAVLVSYNGTSKFLGAPKIDSSSGINIANAVYNVLTQWNIVDSVKSMCFDTTSHNTGVDNGACTLLQKKMDKKLVSYPCRHHMLEVVLRAIFELKLSPSSGPNVSIFERFAQQWDTLDHNSWKNGLEDDIVRSSINQVEQEAIKRFCYEQLTVLHSRNDYKEFLQLALMFLGAERYTFCTPGPTSNARWMSKAIYSLKMFLFREQFQISKSQLNGLRGMCIFLIRLYIKAWYGCTDAIEAPNQDLNFVKDSIAYAQTDSKVSAEILKKIKNHLWYLSEDTIGLAFFDSNVSYEEKREMVKQLEFEEPIVKLDNNRSLRNLNDFTQRNLRDFVSQKTNSFFIRYGLQSSFLQHDPSIWETLYAYEEAWNICSDLVVVNDIAERGVKFIKDFNKALTNSEEEKQLLMQIVEAYRKEYPSFAKSCLV